MHNTKFIKIKTITILILMFSTLSLFGKVNKMIVLDFDNNSGIKKYDSLEKTFADMFRADLKYVKGLNIIERNKTQKSKYTNKKDAIKQGEGLAANWILKGSFTVLKNKMRIDVSIINVETSEIIESAFVEGLTTEYFYLERKLIKKIVKAIHTKETKLTYIINEDKNKESKDFKAVLEYSRAVKLYDEEKFEEAKEAFQKAKKIDANFNYGDRYLEALEKKSIKAEKSELYYEKISMKTLKLLSAEKNLEALKYIRYTKSNILNKKDKLYNKKQLNNLLEFLDLYEIYSLNRIMIKEFYKKEIITKKISESNREILKLSEVFIKNYPNSPKSSFIINIMTYILKKEKNHNIRKKEYQEKLIKKAERYEEERKKIEKKLKKRLKARIAFSKESIKFRKEDLKHELERRKEELKTEKIEKFDKKSLVLNKKIHKMRLEYLKRRITWEEKKLKDLPLTLEKNNLEYLIHKAEYNWKYEELRKIYKKLIKMKNLKDSERLNSYRLMLVNYLQEAKHNPKKYKEAKKFYKEIEKHLDLSFYEKKHIKSGTYLKNIKTLKKSNYEERIEKLEEEETELKEIIDNNEKYLILETTKLKYKISKRNKLNYEYRNLKKDIKNTLREFERIERIIEELEKIKEVIKEKSLNFK